MEPVRGALATLRIALTLLVRDLPAMYAQVGFTGVLV